MEGELLLLSAAFCWALGASIYKRSLSNVSPLTLNLFRSSSAAMFIFLMLLLSQSLNHMSELSLSLAGLVCFTSLVTWGLGDTLYFLGLKLIGVGRTVPMTYSYPLFVLPISILLLGEPLTIQIVIGTIYVVIGVWVMTGEAREEIRSLRDSKLGVMASLGAAACWAFGITCFKMVLAYLDPIFLSFLRLIFLIPFLGILSLMSSRNRLCIKQLSKLDIGLMALGGVIAIGIGDTIYLVGLDMTQANIAAPLGSTTPLFSTALALILLKERLSSKTVAAALIITLGVILLNIRTWPAAL